MTSELRRANADEKEGDFKFVAKEKPTEAELKLLGEGVTAEICAKYSYYSLESYSFTRKTKIGDLQTITYRSNDDYPIFMRDCGTFKKIYKPFAAEHLRYSYQGKIDASSLLHFMNGLYEIKKEYAKLKKKLPEIILCSSERQALSCAAMGFFPVWFNSELTSFIREEKKMLLKYAYKVKYHENY